MSSFSFATIVVVCGSLIPQPSRVEAEESRFERVSRQSMNRFFVIWSALEELDVVSDAKVPRVHGAVAPVKPLVAAFHFLLSTF